MTGAILVDTDVLVDFLRGHKKATSFITEHADHIVLSAISVAELYAGVKGEDELAILSDFVSLFRVVPVSAEIAKVAGLYKRDYDRSHGIGLADAVVAATSDVENAELKTLNVRHYPMLTGLKPPYVR
jgi:predicted nucleic acid-binding protein